MYQEEYKRWMTADLEDADLMPELAKIEGNDDEIKERFAVALKFGTAGLRGVLGAGTNRMNIYVVRQATQGLANWVKTLGGGCELSMSCDIRLCADTAVFGQPETGLGITPGFGGTQRLARLVSPGMAKQLIYSAKNIKADEAYRIGLVNAVYPLEELMPAAEKLAQTIAKNAPIAVRACKKAINDGLQTDIDQAVVIEEKLFGSCFQTADQIEGMGAFLEKRKHEPYQNK